MQRGDMVMEKRNGMVGLKNASKAFGEELMQKAASGYEEHFRIGLEKGSKRVLRPSSAEKFF